MRRFSSVVSVLALAAGLLLAPALAAPALADDEVPNPSGISDPLTIMGDYPADAYSAEAQTLDPLLTDAVGRDLGLSGEEYLADSAAAADASYVVEDLAKSGYSVLGSRIDGTRLTVYVDSDSAARAAEAAGATVVYGAPDAQDIDTSNAVPLSDLYGGQGYYYEDSVAPGQIKHGYECSIGFNGRNESSGANQFVTAGHCVPAGTIVDGSVYALNLVRAGDAPSSSNLGNAIGLPVSGSFHFGDDQDSGLINITQPASWNIKPQVLNWGGGLGGPVDSAPVVLSNSRSAVVGASLCKSGARTGWTCGTILAVDADVNVGGNHVNSIIASTCAGHGDSGGAAVTGTIAIGLTSAGPDAPCGSQGYYSTYFPMVSAGGWGSVASTQNWEPSVNVPPVTVTAPVNGAKILQDSPMIGTMPGANATNRVEVTISGDGTPRFATIGADGKWVLSLVGVPLGAHTFTAKGTWSKWSESATVSGSFTVVAKPNVSRLDGSDRYDAAVSISQNAYPGASPHVPVVYVVTGEGFADALSAAPAAVKQGGPLLLTTTGTLPNNVRTEIQRLGPAKIVVVGGPNSVSTGVYNELGTLAPSIQRIGGDDRYAVSRNVIAYAFTSASKAYVATGTNFPDALSAGAAAGSGGYPVLLVFGPGGAVDSATRSALQSLGVSSIKIAGGPNSVTPAVQSSLATIAATSRLTGGDRFEASIAINRDAFPSTSTLYVATGYNFPDALAGAALAGKNHAPLYVSLPDCLPMGVLADAARYGVSNLTLLGGPNSLNPSVMSLTSCTI